MTDFFVLLDQPRQPWLDPDALKEKYHQLTRLTHPDVKADEPGMNFEEVNEAYRVLSDPKLRIQHLLTLEGRFSTTADRTLADDLQELFLQIGMLSQKVKLFFARIGAESSALTLSILKSELLQLRSEVDETLKKLESFYEGCLTSLEKLNEVWNQDRTRVASQLRELHDRMAYLARWIMQLKEMQFQLSSSD